MQTDTTQRDTGTSHLLTFNTRMPTLQLLHVTPIISLIGNCSIVISIQHGPERQTCCKSPQERLLMPVAHVIHQSVNINSIMSTWLKTLIDWHHANERTFRMRSRTAICMRSPICPTASDTPNSQLTARSWAWLHRNWKALRFVDRSCSVCKTCGNIPMVN